MTAVTYLEGRPRDHRGEQECILILLTAESLPQMPACRHANNSISSSIE